MAPLLTGALNSSEFIAHGSPLENCIASTSIFREMQ